MWPYWLLFLIPVWGVLAPKRLPIDQARLVWCMVGVLLALMMGFRHEVGGDWATYRGHFDWVANMSFRQALGGMKDPGYYGASWLIARLGGNVYLLNLLCAVPLAWGTVALARRQPMPWLALLAATPYLLIVVGMGYTRQSAAIGFAMLGLVALGNGKARSFVIWVLVGAAFHKTAVLLIPIAALAATRHRIWTMFWVGVTAIFAVWFLLYDRSQDLWNAYVRSDYANAASGAFIRIGMNAVAAVLLLLFREKLVPDVAERRLWTWMALIALACVPLLTLSLTAVDRMALYFIPLQIFVFARMPHIAATTMTRTLIVLGIIGYYALVLFVWLNFAENSRAWVPYQLMPFWN